MVNVFFRYVTIYIGSVNSVNTSVLNNVALIIDAITQIININIEKTTSIEERSYESFLKTYLRFLLQKFFDVSETCALWQPKFLSKDFGNKKII